MDTANRILIITPVFPPELSTSGRICVQLAEELARQGYTVTVVTAFPSRPGGKLYPGVRRRLWQREWMDTGYELVRVFSFLSSESSLRSRFWENLSFGILSGLVLFFTRKVRVVYANTWPILANSLVALVARLKGIPFVMGIQDIYPESLVAQGRIGSQHWFYQLLLRLDTWAAHQATQIVAISANFAKHYCHSRRLVDEQVQVVPNWIDPQLSAEISSSVILSGDGIRAGYGLDSDAFLLVVGGNISRAAGVETAVQAFYELHEPVNLHLLVAGEGQSLANCQVLARTLPQGRIFFHTPWPIGETLLVLQAADVLLLTTTGSQSMASVPSKLTTYLLAGKPILAQALPGSDVADLINKANCGWVVEPGNPQILAETIRSIVKVSPEERRELGESGRQFAIKYLDRAKNLPKLVDVVIKAGFNGHY